MKVLHTVSGIWKHTGGPAEVIPLLCRHLLDQGAEVSMATLDGEFSDTTLTSKKAGVGIYTFPVKFRRCPWYSSSLRVGLRQLINDADIVHGHGMWEYMNWCTGSETLRQKKPYIISFHGSIMNTTQNWRLKHRLAWKLLDGHYVQKAFCLHACTEDELLSIRSIGLTNPVALVPNGIEVWPAIPQYAIEKLVPQFTSKKNFLFLSRIHPSKGVFELVDAWSNIAHRPDEWQLVIAGPGLPVHVERLTKLIHSKGKGSRIIYIGPCFGNRRIAAFQGCDALVLPSYTENFGLVVGEAMACGKPVIATHGAPWPDLVNHRCGWWVPNTVEALRIALLEAIQAGDVERKAMGQRGKELILKKYTWPQVAKQMLQTYEWILGGGQTPSWAEGV